MIYDEEKDIKKFNLRYSDIYTNGINAILNKNLSTEQNININEHMDFFKNKLNLPRSYCDELFIYLTNHNENSDSSFYRKSVLADKIDFHRCFKEKTGMLVDNTSQINSINQKAHGVKLFIKEILNIKSLSVILDKLKLTLSVNRKSQRSKYIPNNKIQF